MGYDKDRLLELCTLASTEQDPGMMLKLVREINLVLAAKEKRVRLDLFPVAPGTGAIIHAGVILTGRDFSGPPVNKTVLS